MKQLTILLALVVLAVPNRASALEPKVETLALTPSGANEVDEFAGAFQHETKIVVPPFHGIEPRLSLAYSSTRGLGTLGAGWRLRGVSFVERRGPRRGTPAFDSSDMFWLDDQEMIPCTALGGTHCTKRQRFQRITYAAGEWRVRDKDGTLRIYAARHTTTAGTHRWYLTSVVDPRGNQVTYAYRTITDYLYLDTITFGAAVVKLYWEARPDRGQFALGGAVAKISSRLRTVDVRVGAARARAYAIGYAQSEAGLSLLASIRQCGRDCTVDAGGVVSGGTWLPAETFTYAPGGNRFKAATSFAAPDVPSPGLQADFLQYSNYWNDGVLESRTGSHVRTAALVDMNGDGRTDYVSSPVAGGLTSPDCGGIIVYLNRGDGFARGARWSDTGCVERNLFRSNLNNSDPTAGSVALEVLSDLNGDGLPDRVVMPPTEWYSMEPQPWTVAFNTGSGFAAPRSWPAPGGLRTGPQVGAFAAPLTLLRDMNADGRLDYVAFRLGASFQLTGEVDVHWNTGNGFAVAAETWRYPVRYMVPLLIDLNGDLLPDAVQKGAFGKWYVALNNGRGFEAEQAWKVPSWAADYAGLFGFIDGYQGIRIGDVIDMNGDGLVDLVFSGPYAPYPGANLQVWLNDGSGFATTPIEWGGRWTPVGQAWASSYEEPPPEGGRSPGGSWSSSVYLGLVDLDGDALPDRVTVGSGTWGIEANNGLARAHLMTSANNELGGALAVTYSPSSVWSPTLLPNVQYVVATMTATDGHGGAITTRHEYTGGLWSPDEARFLGFRRVKVIDATGAYTEHLFTQHVADPNSTLEALWVRDSSDRRIRYDAFSYARNGNGRTTPYKSLLAEKWAYECNGDATCKAALVTYGYDGYGNVTLMVEHGDTRVDAYGVISVDGDERTTKTTYVANDDRYLVGYRSTEQIYAGVGTTGTLLRQSRAGYDGQPVGMAPIRGNLTLDQRRLIGASGDRFVARTMTYDACGNQLTETDPLGHRMTTVWDAACLYPIRVTNALGHSTTTSWDRVCAAKTSVTNANGQITSTAYDPLCRPIREDRADHSFTVVEYLGVGDPDAQRVKLSISDGALPPDAQVRWQLGYFDGLGRIYRTVAEGDRTVDTQFDARGLEIRRSVPYATGEARDWMTKEYDAARRVTRLIHPDQTALAFEYLDWGKRSYDELGKPIEHLFDAYGRLRRTTETNGAETQITNATYDLLGRLVRIRDAAGNVMAMSYDSLGRKTTTNDPDLGVWRYAYDDAGNVVTQTDAKGQALTFEYDVLDRLIRKRADETLLARFVYDEARPDSFNIGQLTTMTDRSGSTERDYDTRGRLARESKVIDGERFTLSQRYDLAGRVRDLTYPGGEVVRHRYNAAGDLIEVGPYVTGATYNARGKVVARTLGNGLTESFTYDPRRHWLTGIEVRNGDALVDDASYQWDARGEIVAKSTRRNANDNWTYRYDDLRRLIRADNLGDATLTQIFRYDAIGNMQAQTGVGAYTYPEPGSARPHAPLTAGIRAFTYDRNGNRLSDGTRNYRYDVENRLVGVDATTYVYDGEGTRVKAGDMIEIGKYLEKSGGCVRTYYYFGAIRVARRDGCTREVHYYHAGFDRSARKITDAAGQVARRQVVTPFGQLTNVSGIDDAFGLGGERIDASGLYHLGARYLDPVVGQFTQPDPSGDADPAKPQTLNRYAYAYNNPIRIIDPTGYDGEGGDDGGGDDGGGDAGGDAGGDGGAGDGGDSGDSGDDGDSADAANDSADEGPSEDAAEQDVASPDVSTDVAPADAPEVSPTEVDAVPAPAVPAVDAPDLDTLDEVVDHVIDVNVIDPPSRSLSAMNQQELDSITVSVANATLGALEALGINYGDRSSVAPSAASVGHAAAAAAAEQEAFSAARGDAAAAAAYSAAASAAAAYGLGADDAAAVGEAAAQGAWGGAGWGL